MTEETESRVLEILKRMQASLSRLESSVSDLGAALRAVKSHMAGFMQSEFRQDTELADLRHRIDRIERRLARRD
jgi:predicted  nucleic acid-binding Zn-ribbon protein